MGGMPYPLEKGLFPLVIEHWFNEGLERTWSWARPRTILRKRPGPRRRLRAIWRYCHIANEIRQAKDNPGQETLIESVTAANSFVYSSMFTSPAIASVPAAAIASLQKLLAEDWFGMKWDPSGGPNGTGGYRRPLARSWSMSASLGWWSGYYGDVELIICETLQRTLEVSLGLEHQTAPPTTPVEQKALEDKLSKEATQVWPIYLFVACPQPWFGTSVTWQRHKAKSAVRGQVTTVLQTPGHHRPVAPSPVDLEGDKSEVPAEGLPSVMLKNPYYLQGRDRAGANSGYDGKYIDAPKSKVDGGDPRRAATGGAVDQGMWTITHENHDSAIVWSTFAEPPRGTGIRTDPTQRRGGIFPQSPPTGAPHSAKERISRAHSCRRVGQNRRRLTASTT